MKHTLAPPLLLAALFAATARAAVETSPWEVDFAVGLDLCSKQLTYGLIDNPHAILTPSAEMSFTHRSGLTIALTIEAIFDTTNFGAKEGGYNDRRYKYQELTPGITLAYAWDTTATLGSTLETAINYTYEYHPSACKKPALGYANPGTRWLNFEATLPDLRLIPTLTIEYNLDDRQDAKGGIYATFDLRHDFALGHLLGLDDDRITLTPILGIAAANKARNQADFDSDDTFMLRDAYTRLECTIALTESLTLTPYLGCHQQLGSDARRATGDDPFVAYGGLSLGYSF